MPGLMHRSCRTVEAPVNPWSRAQAQLQADPRGLLHEAHRLVDRKDRPVSLVVPRLDVVNTETLLGGERDAVRNRLLHAGCRGERGPLAQQCRGSVVQRPAKPLSATVGQYPEVEPVAVGMEKGRLVTHINGSDDATVVLGDPARL